VPPTQAREEGKAASTPIKERESKLRKERWMKERLQARGGTKKGGKDLAAARTAQGRLDDKAEGVVSSLADLCKGSEHRCDRIQRFNGLIDLQVLYHLLARALCCALV
jgi:hypothetical protein